MALEYKWEEGSFVCYQYGKRLLATEQVVLLVDIEAGILMKHGARDQVQLHWARMQNALAQHPGFAALADDLVMVDGPREVEELNQLLQCTGYVRVYLDKLAQQAAQHATCVLDSFRLRPEPPGPAPQPG